jgi:allophanate hydrolase subunit 2
VLAQDYTSAALEVTFGGLTVRAHGDVMVALTGAAAPVTVDDRQVAHRSPFQLRDGETLKIGTPAVGLRTYLSVRGGVEVPAVLGSRATDTLSGIGPPSVKAGDLLPQPPGACPAAAIGLEYGLKGPRCVGTRRAKDRNFPAKASFEGPSRSRPAVSPSCFWPIIR